MTHAECSSRGSRKILARFLSTHFRTDPQTQAQVRYSSQSCRATGSTPVFRNQCVIIMSQHNEQSHRSCTSRKVEDGHTMLKACHQEKCDEPVEGGRVVLDVQECFRRAGLRARLSMCFALSCHFCAQSLSAGTCPCSCPGTTSRTGAGPTVGTVSTDGCSAGVGTTTGHVPATPGYGATRQHLSLQHSRLQLNNRFALSHSFGGSRKFRECVRFLIMCSLFPRPCCVFFLSSFLFFPLSLFLVRFRAFYRLTLNPRARLTPMLLVCITYHVLSWRSQPCWNCNVPGGPTRESVMITL